MDSAGTNYNKRVVVSLYSLLLARGAGRKDAFWNSHLIGATKERRLGPTYFRLELSNFWVS